MAWNISVPKSLYYDHKSPELHGLIRGLKNEKVIAIDTETTGLVVWKDLPLYWSLAWGNHRITLNASVLPFFKELFDDPYRDWVFANAKFDAHMLANVGVNIEGRFVDVQVMHSLLYEDRDHGLKDIANHILGWRWSDFQDTFGRINKEQSAEDLIRRAERENFGLLVEYAANDAWGTYNCYLELKKQLELAFTDSLFVDKPPYITTLWDLFDKTEVPYTKVLWHCERNGVLMDQEYLQSIAPTAIEEIQDIEREFNRAAGKPLNLQSTQQMQEFFFGDLGLTPIKKTKGGKTGVRKPALDADVLQKYADAGVKEAANLLRHRELSKLYGTYIKGIGNLLDPFGRIHTRFNQDVVRTGRLSSSGPNLQNIPRPDNDKWKLRGAFVAPPGRRLIVADYEQLEMRLLACASGDKGMIEVINKGWDIHMGNASLIFGIPYDEIKRAKEIDKLVKSGELPAEALTARVQECLDARTAAKTIGFGLVYGMGEKKLANDLGLSVPEAVLKIQKFKESLPAVDTFTQESVQEAEEYGFAFTILGRRRNVPEMLSHRRGERQRGERIAVNTPIQGGAADVVKIAQTLCFKAGLHKKYDAIQLLQVHDELIFELPEEAVEPAMEEIQEWMEHPFIEDMAVPLAVDIGSGKSWMEAK